MIVVNFKTYEQATGAKALALAKICKKVADETKVRIIAVPQLADIKSCVDVGVECWAQHVDAVEPGRHTGFVLLEDLMAAGAKGTLLNHSEHKLDWEVLKSTLVRVDGKIEVCVCAVNLEECQRVATLQPKYVAYEPTEFIGNKDLSVATERGGVIKQVVQVLAAMPIIIGAGIHSAVDVKAGLEFGAKGILVATDVVLAEDPEKDLRELALAFTSQPAAPVSPQSNTATTVSPS
ncbi:MAG: triose-phosphate isomerase [bacterium]|nr:triose-phosphate isomerase [bacterium]